MSQTDLRDSVRAEIEARCGGDASQYSAIFSPSKRVFVEAPAGYGKTTVMTGRACWLLASGEVHPPKRILALTFSVAAARRLALRPRERQQSRDYSWMRVPERPAMVSAALSRAPMMQVRPLRERANLMAARTLGSMEPLPHSPSSARRSASSAVTSSSSS